MDPELGRKTTKTEQTKSCLAFSDSSEFPVRPGTALSQQAVEAAWAASLAAEHFAS